MSIWPDVQQAISEASSQTFKISERQSISGGDINQAYRVSDGKTTYFVKTNRAQLHFMFEAEMRALDEIRNSDSIRVPRPVVSGVSGRECFLIMEYLDLTSSPNSQQFGRNLAAMHQCHNEQFGFYLDNTIGSTPQLNQWMDQWPEFYSRYRLKYQLDLAKKNHFGHRLYDLGMKLCDRVSGFFTDYRPDACLLHGDLWSGNWGAIKGGEPVIFDPASYYGDREADLAMMELFGNPGRAFFDAYSEAYPIDAGYAVRKKLYNLYHILNHANLFGSGYALQAENMTESLLAECQG